MTAAPIEHEQGQVVHERLLAAGAHAPARLAAWPANVRLAAHGNRADAPPAVYRSRRCALLRCPR